MLKSSPDYKRIKDALDAEFGYCIRYCEDEFLYFQLRNIPFDILNDEKKIAILPYKLDCWSCSDEWLYYIQGLVKRRRFDLLLQLRFPKIKQQNILWLIEAKVPASVLGTAVNALKKQKAESRLLSMLAFAGIGSRIVPLCPERKIPVFVLHYLHQADRALPENITIVDGLKDESIPFWTYAIESEATDLLDLVLQNGDQRTRKPVDSLRGKVSLLKREAFHNAKYYKEMDVYLAVLVRLRFSAMCNKHVMRNYKARFEPYDKNYAYKYHVLQALIDARQYTVIAKMGVSEFIWSREQNEAAVDELSQSGHLGLVSELLKFYARRKESLIWTVRSLVRRKANEAYIQVVLENLKYNNLCWNLDHTCAAPLKVLQTLAFDASLSPERAERMISGIGSRYSCSITPHGSHIIHLLIFWEAPEAVLNHFFDQIQSGFRVSSEMMHKLAQSPKYSEVVIRKYAEHMQSSADWYMNTYTR